MQLQYDVVIEEKGILDQRLPRFKIDRPLIFRG